jgi:hypothetical protein
MGVVVAGIRAVAGRGWARAGNARCTGPSSVVVTVRRSVERRGTDDGAAAALHEQAADGQRRQPADRETLEEVPTGRGESTAAFAQDNRPGLDR